MVHSISNQSILNCLITSACMQTQTHTERVLVCVCVKYACNERVHTLTNGL